MLLSLIQIIISLLLLALILLQAKGTGLGTVFGGSSPQYHSKRGVEKTVFAATVVLAFLFVIIALVNLKL